MSAAEDRVATPGPHLAGAALPGAALLDVVALMDRLRSPGGCPWDAEQTHGSLTRYLVEETYEVLDAVEALDGTPEPETELAEELGDVLLQVVFHARVAAERGAFDVDDVARALAAKLRRRHPHVFGDHVDRAGGPATGDGVQARWDELKAMEKPSRGPVDGIPLHLPALARADKLLSRLDRAGIPLADVAPDPATTEERLGAELLALVVRARATGVDAEAALRATVRSAQTAAAGGGDRAGWVRS